MNILFLTDNFPPESNAPASRTFDHCVKWVKLGYNVTVITCFPNFPKGKVYKGYKNKLYSKEIINGIRVIRVWSYITKNEGFFKRILDYISFGISSFIFGIFQKFDVIIATSPQFFTAISGHFLSFFKNKPWIMEVRDLWPDSIVAVGSLNNNSLLFKFLKRVEIKLYDSAHKIIVVTDSFKNYLISKHNINNKKVGVFKNGIVLRNVKKVNNQKSNILKNKLKIQDKIIISYIGTHGLAHGLRFILRSIQKVKNKNIIFIFIGDGAEKENLLKFSKKLKIKNFKFLDSVSKNKILDFISISDYALVNLKKSDDFKNVIPSKIFENIALYKPILLGVEGESKELINKYNVGVPFVPENINSFLNAVDKIQKFNIKIFKNNCNKMIKEFDREKIAENMIKFILN